MEISKEKVEKLFRETATNLMSAVIDAGLENGSISERRANIQKKKYELQIEETILEDKLKSVTTNCYEDIGDMMNEYIEKRIELLKETYEKIKKYLDDNNLPYEDEDDEEEDKKI